MEKIETKTPETENPNSSFNNELNYFNEQIQLTETEIIKTKKSDENNIINELNLYSVLQNSLIDYIEKSNNYENYIKKKLKKKMLNMLNQSFEDNNISRCILILTLENIFYINIMPFYDCTEVIIELASSDLYNDETKRTFKFYDNIYKLESERIDKILIKEVNKSFSKDDIVIDFLPEFLLIDFHKLLKQKIFLFWSINFHIEVKTIKLENYEDLEFIFLYERFQDFYDDRITLFDLKFLNNNSDISILLFKTLYYSNLSYLKYDGNLKIFINNTNRYLNLMGVKNENNIHGKIINECIDNSKKELVKYFFYELINKIKGENIEQIHLFIIFCMSMTLNNIAIYSQKDKKVVFSPLLKCSAKEKVFLHNFLKTFEYYLNKLNIYFKNNSLYYNAQVENYVFAFLTKSYTKVLYDEQNRNKIDITTNKTLLLMEKLNKGMKDDDIETDSEEDINTNFDFHTLDDIERDNLYTIYKVFKSNYIKIKDKKKKKNKNAAEKLFKSIKIGFKNIKKLINEPKNENPKIKLDISIYKKSPLLKPIDPINTATHICICISSNSDNQNLEENMFSNIINYKNYQSIDYYIYNWNKQNDFSGKVYGRLLSFIIAGREIFKFQTISLFGVGYGCKIIKKCLKQLSIINEYIDVSDIIQHVILINGKLQINFSKQSHFDLLKIISGNLINICQNQNEYIIIPKDFANESKVYLPKIINYDLLTDFHIIDSEHYILKINKILNKIKSII